MIITKLVNSSFSKLRMLIYIDYEYAFPLYTSDLKKLHLKEGDIIDSDKKNKILKEYVYKNALKEAYNLLLKGDYTRKMLFSKLSSKKYPDDICNEIVDLFLKKGYINDLDYARRFCRYALESKKKGLLYVGFELKNKGISEEDISMLKEEFKDLNNIDEIAEKKLAYIIKDKEKPDYKDYKKLSDYLFRQGFSYDEISSALTNLKGNYEY